MSRSANVTSIDAVQQFKLALQEYEIDVREVLTDLVLELRRAVEWIEVDRARYWPNEVRKATDQVAEARINLERCEISMTPGDKQSCYDERKALEKAKRRLRTAEEKVRAVQQWRTKVRREAEEFEARLSKFTNLLDAELPRAIAALQRMLRALDRYTQRDVSTDAPPHTIGGPAVAPGAPHDSPAATDGSEP